MSSTSTVMLSRNVGDSDANIFKMMVDSGGMMEYSTGRMYAAMDTGSYFDRDLIYATSDAFGAEVRIKEKKESNPFNLRPACDYCGRSYKRDDSQAWCKGCGAGLKYE